jgi:hypothetical protein
MDALSAEAQEKAIRRIGEATVRVWSELSQEVQRHLFEAAVAGEEETAREELASFLHGKHVRTTDALKARALAEPDSKGG